MPRVAASGSPGAIPTSELNTIGGTPPQGRPARLATIVAAALLTVLGAAPAAQAISREQAERRALKALGVERGDAPVIVFGLHRTLRAATRISEAGTGRRPRGGRVDADTGVVNSRMPALGGLRLRRERAYFFYADLRPFQTYQHPGRVALVGRRSGRVRVSERLSWPPLIRGRLPAFMRSADAYHDRRNWVLYRPWKLEAVTARAAQENHGPIGLDMQADPMVDMSLRGRVASLLAAARSCSVRVSDTLGDHYDFGAVDRTRGWLGATFKRLEDLDSGFVDERYVLRSGTTPIGFAEDVIRRRGCREVLLYIAGGGWGTGGESAVSVGVRPAPARRIRQQVVTARQVRSLLRAHRDVTFKVIVDAPYAGGFRDALAPEGNALMVATPGGSRARSFAYLPEVELPGGRLRGHPGNRWGLLELTNRALYGLERFLASSAEIEQAAAEQAAGRSLLAWMMARAFALGADQQYTPDPAPPDTQPPPVATNRRPAAAAATVSTPEDTAAAIALAASDPDGDPLAYSILAGPVHGTLTGSGAQRTYAPSPDFHGVDGFTYRVADGRGGLAEARVTITVTSVNDAPVIATSSGSASFAEDGPPVVVDPGLVVDDVDDAELEGATVSVASALADDELLFTDQNGIAGSSDAGVLTLTGTSSLANYRAALRSVAYEHTGENPPAVRTVELRVDDGDGLGPAATRAVDITPVNDAPAVTASAGSASFTEGLPPVAVDPDLAVGDPDSAFLSGATVDLGSSFTADEDVLGFTSQNGITGAYDAGTGLLTLSGTTTVANYESALRSVTYDNTSNDPATATRTASLRVTDAGGLASNAGTRDITVAGANDRPVVGTSGGAVPYTEGDPATVVDGGVTVTDGDDADLEGAAILVASGFQAGDELLFTNQNGITGAYDAGTGVLTLSGTSSVANYQTALRSVEYRHTGDDPAVAKTVGFTADDGDDDSDPASRTISITRVNDAPALDTTGAALAYPENAGPLAADAGIALTDPDSAEISGATVQVTASHVAAQDELAFTDQLGITGSYDDGTGTLTLSGDATIASYEAALRAVTYENVSDDPSPPTRTLTFQATDAEGDSSAGATRDITLGAANDAPTITTTATPLAYTEGDPATAVDSGLTVADPDDANLESATVRVSAGFEPADGLLFSDQNGISGAYNSGTGVLTLTGTSSVANYQTALRSVEYGHAGDNPALVKTVELRADDGDGLGPASIRNVGVTRVNDGPQITTTGSDLAYTENAGPVAIDGGLGVTDPDSTQLSGATVTITSSFQPAQDDLAFADQLGITGAYDDSTGVLTLSGTASVADYRTALRSVTYVNVSEGPTPAARTISFQATDADAATSNSATRGIAITAVNDPPTAVDDAGTTDEDTTLNASAPGVLSNDTDVDAGDTKTVVRLNGSLTLTGTSAEGAAVTINADGSYAYDPGSVFQGLSTGQQDTDSFTYTMEDGAGAQSTATVSLTISGISDAPTANADSFDAIGNTALFAGTTRPAGEAGKVASGSVLANDTDPDTPQAELVAVPVTDAPTTLGGTITIEADGNFTYHPDDADTGVTDTFTYTVSDGDISSTGTLNLPLTGQVWYVRNNALGGGDGTSDGHFDTIAEAETASGAGDTVYVLDGDDTPTGLGTGFAMEAGERLIGEHSGVSLDPDGGGPLGTEALHAGTAGAHPTLTANDEDVVVMASGSTVDGFEIDPSGTGGGISGGSGTVTITDVNVTDSGTAGTQPGVDLDGTSGASTVSDLTVTTNGATGVRLNGAGTVSFTPSSTISIATTGANGLVAANTSMGTSTFDSIAVTGSGTGGVSLTDTTGSTTFGDLSLTTTSGATAAFRLSNAGTVSVPPAGTANLSATGGPAVDVTATSGATLAFDAVDSSNSAGDGINLDGLGSGTFSAGSGSTITGAAGIAFDLNGGSGTVDFPGTITNGEGSLADITGRSGGNVAFSGPITETGDSDAAQENGGISLSGNTAGSTVFSNATTKDLTTGEDHAVVMSGSDGHTLTFANGNLDIDTTSGKGLEATTSGTLNVTGSINTIDTTTGTALNVTDTDVGSGNPLTFQSIAANGASKGIQLSNTGTNSALTVQSTGAGTCTHLDQTGCTGGRIRNTTGGDDPGTTPAGTGIVLNNTRGVSLTRMHVHDHTNYGVRGTSVVGFTLANSVVNGTNGTDTTFLPDKEGSVRFSELTGTVSVTDTAVSGGANNNVIVQNTTGTLNSTFTNLRSGAVSSASAEDAMMVEGTGTSTTNATVQTSTFTNAPADIFLYIGDGTGGGTLSFTGNAITNNHPAIVTGGGGVTLAGGANGPTTMTVQGNTLRDSHAAALDVNKSTGGGSLTATINNNQIGVTGVANSGSLDGNGIDVRSGQGNATYHVTNNTVRQYNSHGMAFFAGTGTAGQSGTVNINLSGNTIQEPGTNPSITLFQGIRVESGISTTDTFQTCVNIGGGNLITGSSDAANKDWRILGFGLTTVRLPTYGGGAQDDTAATAFINGRFGSGANGVASSDGSSAWSGSGTTCP